MTEIDDWVFFNWFPKIKDGICFSCKWMRGGGWGWISCGWHVISCRIVALLFLKWCCDDRNVVAICWFLFCYDNQVRHQPFKPRRCKSKAVDIFAGTFVLSSQWVRACHLRNMNLDRQRQRECFSGEGRNSDIQPTDVSLWNWTGDVL